MADNRLTVGTGKWQNRKRRADDRRGQKTAGSFWEPLLLTVLFWYPLRHIHWGLDFWDTGYNYGNFVYMERMESMWKFATYLANVTGHFLTGLPGAGSLVGMNLYTGLFVSLLAILGYWFCTRRLGISGGIAFVGEMAAVSLCWCPTALLYNYLTYVFFLLGVVFLYQGLVEEKMGWLFGAGICLGANVFVRFSNLPQAALIVAVWVYAFLAAGERAAGAQGSGGKGSQGIAGEGIRLAARCTGWCLGGYLCALAVMLGCLHIRYGIDNYAAGILRLFAMTDNAADYKAGAMLEGLIHDYIENLYWAKRIGIIVLGGMAVFGAAWAVLRGHARKNTGAELKITGVINTALLSRGGKFVWRLLHIWFGAVAVLMLVWLYGRGFCSLDYHTYGPMQRPGVLFLMLTLGVAAVRIFHPDAPKEEKLISGLVVLVVLLTSIGSNNKNLPSLNNLFVACPYTLWQCRQFIRGGKPVWEYGKRFRLIVCSFPAKAVMTAFLALFLFQSVLFGAGFVFAEATGIRNATATVENNEILRGVKMTPERAEWMTGLTGYLEEQGLRGREVILFGGIPAMSYYLAMPPAFNTWSDLDSYVYGVMEADLNNLTEEVENGRRQRPVILLDREYYLYMTEGAAGLNTAQVPQSRQEKIVEKEEKLRLIQGFIETLNYDLSYENEKFVLLK